MKALNKQTAPKSVAPERIIQFGEGNFASCICRLDCLQHEPKDRLQRQCCSGSAYRKKEWRNG